MIVLKWKVWVADADGEADDQTMPLLSSQGIEAPLLTDRLAWYSSFGRSSSYRWAFTVERIDDIGQPQPEGPR